MRIFAGAILLTLCLAPTAGACSCAPIGPACQAVWSDHIAAVFVGTVTSSWPATPFSTGFSRLEVRLSVKEAFVGVEGSVVTVFTESSESACGFSFRRGETYLVYASRFEGQLTVSLCSRTFLAKYRDEDLSYLRSLSKRGPEAWVYGSVKRYTFDPLFRPKYEVSIMDHYFPPEEDIIALASEVGRKVTLKGANLVKETTVNANGTFEFNGLSPGSYTVSVDLPPKLVQLPPRSVAVVAKGCSQVDFRTRLDGQIIGRVIRPKEARPDLNLTVFVFRLGDDNNRDRPFAEADGKHDGSFEVVGLPVGRYTLGAYLWGSIPGSTPGSTTLAYSRPFYFTGTYERKEALPIEVAEGQKVSGYTFTLRTLQLTPDGPWRYWQEK